MIKKGKHLNNRRFFMFSVRLIKAEGLRRVLVVMFYFAYTITMIYCMVHTPAMNDRVVYGVLWLFVPFGTLYEIIRFQYAKANDSLHQHCNPKAAMQHLRFVNRADFLKRYILQAAYLESAAMIDQNEIDDAEKFIADRLDKMLNTNKKLNFEYNYLHFTICVVREDKKQIHAYYLALERIFQVQKKFHTDLLSLKSSIDGAYYLTEGRLDKSQKAFSKANPDLLGNRERAWHYYYLSRLSYQLNQPNYAEQYYIQATRLAPGIPLFSNRPTNMT